MGSIAEFLDLFAKQAGECMYIQRRGYRTERWSYGEVARAAQQFAGELEARGVAKGDRVLLWGENSAEWVAAFFGCVLRGAIAVPMDDGATEDFANRVRIQVGARVALVSGKHAERVRDSQIVILEQAGRKEAKSDGLSYSAVAVEAGDPLEIIFTSGTTAEPKGVVISHGNVLSNLAPLEAEMRNYMKYERWVHPIRFLNLLPLSHVFGQFLGMFLPPLMAGTVVFQASMNPSEVMETVRQERVSVVVAVPRMLQSLKEKVQRDLENEGQATTFERAFAAAEGQHFLRRWWRFRDVRRKFGWKFWAFISGGAALDRETEEFWGRLGYAVIQGYGLTETTSLVSVNHPFRLGKGSIGKVLPGREVKLDEDGEILVRGGGVASGYWGAEGAGEVTGEEGWYRTGDIGALDAAGNLYFKGRKKDVLVTPAGMNVYPEDLENALRRQAEVRDCVVVGVDRGGNAEPCAVLLLREGADAAAVVSRANRELAEFQRMHEWLVWPESDFPRTATGKVRVVEVRDEIVRKGAVERASTRAGNPLAEVVARISGRAVGQLRPEANLDEDLHLTSLERVELLSALEDRYQVDLSETRFSAVRTVGDLEKMIASDERSEQSKSRAMYNYPRWTLRWPVTWIRALAFYGMVRPAVYLLGWPQFEGRENLTGVRGPVLVVCNHIGDVDAGFVQTASVGHSGARMATATGGEALQALRTPLPERGFVGRCYDRVRWVLGVGLLNLFPLPRDAAFRKSFAYAGECVDRGYSVLIFPEGHHTTDGRLLPFRVGAGLLAKHLGIPVVPMRIDGLYEVKRAGKRFAGPGKIKVKIGKPVLFDAARDAAEIAKELQQRVALL